MVKNYSLITCDGTYLLCVADDLSIFTGRLLSGTQASLEDQGIDMSSPGRHSPGGSSGGSSISRHSLSSLDSGRASGPGSEAGKVS